MNRKNRVGLLLALALLFGAAKGAPVASPAKLDALIDAFFKPPEIQNVSLSPNGATIAFQDSDKGGLTLRTVDAMTLKTLGYVGGDPGLGIVDVRWADDNRIIYYLARWNKYYEDLISANRTLTDRRRVSQTGFFKVVDATPYVKNDVVIREHESEVDTLHFNLMRVDLSRLSDAPELVGKNPGDFVGWGLDLAGEVRIGYKQRDNGYADIMHRWKKSEPWTKLDTPRDTWLGGFSPNGKMALLSYPKDGERGVLQGFDFTTGQFIGEPIADPIYDVNASLLRDSVSYELVGLTYDADLPKRVWFDQTYAALYDHIRKGLPNQEHWFIGITANHELLVNSSSDVQPGYYWLLDLKTLKGRTFKKSRPWINPAEMYPMRPVQFPARDGQIVRGYLTKPSERPGPFPLILLIHGGPYTRDIWGFDSECQFFAALGYAVLQVNYRGSSGLGEAYQLKTMLDVARVSVDDVSDAARWAVETGLADPARTGIYGGSYGGYIALGCVTRYPDQFRCALGFAGVYDWEMEFRGDVRDNSGFFDWQQERWGDAKEHPEKFRPYSPVFQAAAVKAAVWLGHGGADGVVHVAQTKAMAAALKKAGKTVEVKLDTWGVHGFPDPDKRREHYRAIAAFLKTHLPP